uniref:Uncharacterized protein n=1 Tax=Pseudocercospora fijiensis TaxID=1873960 RepID=A0A516EZP3_9PEZI|nr:hypothetical protein [Pseudocercospora fijiensis]QDO71973.1 hypothetical protein [Pseudocercospora fijiensis]
MRDFSRPMFHSTTLLQISLHEAFLSYNRSFPEISCIFKRWGLFLLVTYPYLAWGIFAVQSILLSMFPVDKLAWGIFVMQSFMVSSLHHLLWNKNLSLLLYSLSKNYLSWTFYLNHFTIKSTHKACGISIEAPFFYQLKDLTNQYSTKPQKISSKNPPKTMLANPVIANTDVINFGMVIKAISLLV